MTTNSICFELIYLSHFYLSICTQLFNMQISRKFTSWSEMKSLLTLFLQMWHWNRIVSEHSCLGVTQGSYLGLQSLPPDRPEHKLSRHHSVQEVKDALRSRNLCASSVHYTQTKVQAAKSNCRSNQSSQKAEDCVFMKLLYCEIPFQSDLLHSKGTASLKRISCVHQTNKIQTVLWF